MVTTQDILDAHERIRASVIETPLILSRELSGITSASCYLKLENRQHTGSFKARGAFNKILKVAGHDADTSVITASTGNHGLGVARALKHSGMDGIIYVPENASPAKICALRDSGATIRLHGLNPLTTELHAKQVAADTGQVWISPYNDPEIIAGQGTIGIELTAHLDQIDAIYITVGGGGLVSGIATWIKAHNPETEIVGCLPEKSPEMALSVKAGHIVHLEKAEETLSDGSAGGCEDGSITFPICQQLVDRFILVSEEDIASAMSDIQAWHGERIEGAAGVAVAAMKHDGKTFAGQNIVAIICGGNRTE